MKILRFVGTVVLLFGAATGNAATPPTPVVTSITGYSDGFTVRNGRFTGQIALPPGATNRYKNFLASDSYHMGNPAANPYYWDIQGSNFGAAKGALDFGTSPNPFTSITIVSWSATAIRVKVVASPAFLSCAIALKVKNSTGQTSSVFHDNVAGTISGRGAGQCTWYAASVRLQKGLSIPPTPWGTNGSIPPVGGTDNGYRPKLWDCVIYAGHIAIITTTPVQTNNADGSIKWAFTVSEYNAQWTESLSTSTRYFSLSKPNSKNQRTVTMGIGTNLNASYNAYGYFR
ncbi:MAG: hypothetical protein JSS49_12655 [Planctomycetes bacterium]|nr:hypothetical protein [Planctomycetota bacterium]